MSPVEPDEQAYGASGDEGGKRSGAARVKDDSFDMFVNLAKRDTTGLELKAELEKQALIDAAGQLIDLSHGRILLWQACFFDNVASAKVLLEAGASPLGSPPEYIRTGCHGHQLVQTRAAEISCVHLAASHDNAVLVEVLLATSEFGDLANSWQKFKMDDTRSPLMCVACRHQYLKFSLLPEGRQLLVYLKGFWSFLTFLHSGI